MDIFTAEKRSQIMSRIGPKNTRPEQELRKALFALGFRYRVHDKQYPGKPDIVLPKYRTAIFVNGCFWHGHQGCKDFVIPKTRTEWWMAKISATKERDERNCEALRQMGWQVIEVWECEIEKHLDSVVEEVVGKLMKDGNTKS